ncbi:MAG: hypothetical protein Q8R00_00210 [Candidatus Nanoarchaeia archaeon]|nr:hypothetical protein [Candidatus Nanoarchaeia archaeon]
MTGKLTGKIDKKRVYTFFCCECGLPMEVEMDSYVDKKVWNKLVHESACEKCAKK